jgi:tetratricopeptide (TPR) repeat protein
MTTPAAEILAGAAKALLELGRLDLARRVAGLALTEDSRCANGHRILTVVHEALAEWSEGHEHGRRAVELLPGSPQLRYNLALSTLRLDDYRTGFALMEARIARIGASMRKRSGARPRLSRRAEIIRWQR